MSVKEVKKRLTAKIENFLETSGRFLNNGDSWGRHTHGGDSDWGANCALGAVIHGEKFDRFSPHLFKERAAKILGCTYKEVSDIEFGFIGGCNQGKFADLGRWIRQHYLLSEHQ